MQPLSARMSDTVTESVIIDNIFAHRLTCDASMAGRLASIGILAANLLISQ